VFGSVGQKNEAMTIRRTVDIARQSQLSRKLMAL